MSKGTIIDTNIYIKPTKHLCNFIKTLDNEASMPENILKIYKNYSQTTNNCDKTIFNNIINLKNYTKEELSILNELNKEEAKENITNNNLLNNLNIKNNKESENKKNKKKINIQLSLNDIKWINEVIVKVNKENGENEKVYLHELLENCELVLPENEILERNPVLEERCKKLRSQQEAREYKKMTKDVDSVRRELPEDTIAYQMKQINRQLIAVLQFIFSVAAGFLFGFIGVELIIGNLDFGFRLLLGIMCSLIIALAEIYFLAKKLNEDYDISLDNEKFIHKGTTGGSPEKTSHKEHKD